MLSTICLSANTTCRKSIARIFPACIIKSHKVLRSKAMKILFDIQEKYKETEIHICCDKRSKEAIGLRDYLEGILISKITVHKNQEAKSVTTYEIVRIYSESKKVYVRTKEDTFEVRDRLYVLEETLRDRGFVRISNSEIVNISQIEKLDMSYAGTIKMFMKNGDETFVSRRYVSKIKSVLD